jgi:AAHS family 3-hydroxyphenylpropionic acid transporter
VLGNLVAGFAMDRGHVRLIYFGSFMGAALCVAALSSVGAAPLVTYLQVLGVSTFNLSAQLVTYAITANYYPDEIKTAGLGAMVSASRCGSVLGPLLAGQLLMIGLRAQQVFLLLVPAFAISMVLAAVLLSYIRRTSTTGFVALSVPTDATL